MTESKREHKLGVDHGYGYETDGTNYWLAPALMDAWGIIQDQEKALDATITAVIRAMAESRKIVEAQRRKWWDQVYKDLGLDGSVNYGFHLLEGRLSPITDNKKPDA